MENYELYHHGVKGMKWGVRKDRIKSATGRAFNKAKKVAGDFNAKRKARREMEKTRERERYLMKTPVRKLTTSELQERATILQARKQVLDLEKQCKQIDSELTKQGKNFVKKFVSDSLAPAALESSKSVLKDYFVKIGKDKLGLTQEEESGMKALKKKAEQAKLKRQISDDEKAVRDNESNNELKKQAEEAKYREAIAKADQARIKADKDAIDLKNKQNKTKKSNSNNRNSDSDNDSNTHTPIATVEAGEAYVRQLSQDQTDRLRRLLNR